MISKMFKELLKYTTTLLKNVLSLKFVTHLKICFLNSRELQIMSIIVLILFYKVIFILTL